MNAHRTDRDGWHAAARRLKSYLDSDHRNHRMLADPWSRSAHCMVQGWRIIDSQGRLDYSPPSERIPTWQEAVQKMKRSLYSRKQSRLLDPTTWKFWASHLPRPHLRYIPKRRRTVQAAE